MKNLRSRWCVSAVLALPLTLFAGEPILPTNWDPVLAGDQVMDRLVQVTAPQVKGAHDAELAIIGDYAYIVAEVDDEQAGENAARASIYSTLSIVDLNTLKVEAIIEIARGGQEFESGVLPIGSVFVPRILPISGETLRCYFASERPGERQSQTWYRDFDIESRAFAPTIHEVKIQTRAGTFPMQPQYFYDDAVADGFETKSADFGLYLFDSFKRFDDQLYVAINNFTAKQNALALVHDDHETFEVLGHFNDPQRKGLSESAVNRLPDGKWMAIIRKDGGNKNYLFATSEDGREWSVAREMPFVPNGTNSKPTFDRFGDLYYLGWQENTQVEGVYRSVFNVDVSRDGEHWERKYRFESTKSFQYPTFREHDGEIWLTVTQGDTSDTRKERIMFGKLEILDSGAQMASRVPVSEPAPDRQPNVIVILTDDQGYGDLSCHGHPYLETPHLDQLYEDSIRLTDFHVAPMCTPTRGQLLTGLDAMRSRALVVSKGRQMPEAGLPTMANVFSAGGYATGLFGKWHLGSSWPYRPQDRGFDEAQTFVGWGMTGIAELLNDYTDGTYLDNGVRKPFEGYATDFWFDQAMEWMVEQQEADRPFFCYLPTHTPHRPMWIEAESFDRFEGDPIDESTAGFFGMIENIDDNVGRLERFLRERDLHRDTILVFLTDNGSAHGSEVFNAGMRGKKSTLWEGGHRVPCFIRYPAAALHRGRDLDGLTQVQDLLPTLATLAGVETHLPESLDGTDLSEALKGTEKVPDRTLVIQYEEPEKGNACVARGDWRWISGTELYFLGNDPGQCHNIIADYPEVAKALQDHYDEWWSGFADVSRYEPIYLSSARGEPVHLFGDDMPGGYGAGTLQVLDPKIQADGFWNVKVEEAARFTVTVARWPLGSDLALSAPLPGYYHTGGYRPWPDDWHLLLQSLPKGLATTLRDLPPAGVALPVHRVSLEIAGNKLTAEPASDSATATFELGLPAGAHRLRCWFENRKGEMIAQAPYLTFTPISR